MMGHSLGAGYDHWLTTDTRAESAPPAGECRCSDCDGDGSTSDEDGRRRCRTCDGRGTVEVEQEPDDAAELALNDIRAALEAYDTANVCDGTDHVVVLIARVREVVQGLDANSKGSQS